jgi:hypothetical protein
MKQIKLSLLSLAVLGYASSGFANGDAADNYAFNFWSNDGWSSLKQYGNTNNVNDDGGTAPGSGGQRFDAEYLFYKYDSAANTLSIGLQAGFNLVTNKVQYGGSDDFYYGGDLALSFDGNASITGSSQTRSNSYEYAVDFGLYTDATQYDSSYANTAYQSAGSGGANGVDAAGLYKIKADSNGNLRWHDGDDVNNFYDASSPFAMDEGELVSSLISNNAGKSGSNGYEYTGVYSGYSTTNKTSYFRTVTFSLDSIVEAGETFTVDAHWTMSCGNDDINGQIQLTRDGTPPPPPPAIPEPSIVALIGIGTLGLYASGLRRRKQ